MNKQNKKTMKRNFIYSLAATFITAAVTLGSFTACSSEDLVAEKQNATQAQTYTVNIPATFGDDAGTRAVSFDGITSNSTFSTSEQVYVYNKTKSAMLDGHLSPANLRSGDKVCDLTGTLTGTIEANDQLLLLYNLSTYSSNDLGGNKFEYDNQNGAAPLDGAMAEVVVSDYSGGVLTTTATASFTNVQSMFRLKFTNGSNDISVKRLTIKSANSAIAKYFLPLYAVGSQYTYGGGVTVFPASATSDYLYVALCINESRSSGDVLTFTVIDNNNHVYEGTKAAPSGGFKNGKYYYNTSAITLTQQPDLVAPTLTGTSATADEYNKYVINDSNTPSNNFTISGKSNGYKFYVSNAGIVITLSNLDATCPGSFEFIQSASSSTATNIIVNGTNSITCPDRYQCILAAQDLKLSGNGTLTVTSTSSGRCGLYGTNYNNYGNGNNDYATTTELDVSAQLAAPGYTVIRSARSAGAGLYTWTYTVTPAGALPGKFTINAGGSQVYFSKGNLQATYDGSDWTWAFATNQWGYVGNAEANTSINGDGTVSQSATVDLFGWVGASNTTWTGAAMYGISNAITVNSTETYGNVADENLKSDWGTTIGTGWRTLTKDEWTYLLDTRESGSTVNSIGSARYTLATINTDGTAVNGLIVFPDGVTIANSEADTWGIINNFNLNAEDWSSATQCCMAQWTALAAKGCVFLPAAGFRSGASCANVGYYGQYWSSSPYTSDAEKAYSMDFGGASSITLNPQNYHYRKYGFSVRLVYDAN